MSHSITETTTPTPQGFENFDPAVHNPALSKGTRISFTGDHGLPVYGVVGSLSKTGYRLAIQVPGIRSAVLWYDLDASDESIAIAPLPTPTPLPVRP